MKMKFTKTSFFVLAFVAILVVGVVVHADPLKVAMVLPGNITDKSWNQAGYEGLMIIKEQLGFEVLL